MCGRFVRDAPQKLAPSQRRPLGEGLVNDEEYARRSISHCLVPWVWLASSVEAEQPLAASVSMNAPPPVSEQRLRLSRAFGHRWRGGLLQYVVHTEGGYLGLEPPLEEWGTLWGPIREAGETALGLRQCRVRGILSP